MADRYPVSSPEPTNPEHQKEGGWKRVKSLLKASWNGERPEEFKEWYTSTVVAGVAGFLLGGYSQARHSRVHFIDTHNMHVFSSHIQAQRQLHSAVFMGFVRGGILWGWKLGAFVGVFRNKEGVLNVLTAGAVSGACYRLFIDGLSGMVKGAVLGALVSFPAGFVVLGIDKLLLGPKAKKEMHHVKQEAVRKRKEQWQQRLNGTSDIMADLGNDDNLEGLSKHYKVEPPSKGIIESFMEKSRENAARLWSRTSDKESNNRNS
ncbi:complex I assembly factor TIMMDC1, mitochondrial-like isoform X2 [Dysidea avara]|uniref:complex I assembly factor TIMMDC1, mitochondrial-like isoform X2 n=1 Tax=Dysidea avara TaxID=196820 RepID=UPI00332D43A6